MQPLLLTDAGKIERSDDALGHGFALFSLVDLDPSAAATAAGLERTIGLRTVVIGEGRTEEQGADLADWLERAGVAAVVVRPDFYVFGTATDATEITDLLTSLGSALCLA